MASNEIEKQILTAPTLPNHIQGDGRYLMSLLKSFLEQTATQVNLANGFSAEEINPNTGGYPMPRNFFLSFTRLGGEFTWDHLNDISNLAYYELREDKNIGSPIGLLERTLDTSSTKLPVNYVATVYLYAVSKDGVYSNPSTINYTKPRPDAPTDISITKTNEGTLITFLAIPSNCIGANIYVDGKKYQALDNVYLLKDATSMKQISIAYYDQFGEGELGTLWLILPDVTGFLVERNGPELDFYWNALNIYGVKYVVKVGATLSWEQGIELFSTTTNDKNRMLYPNTGVYYLMVKAYDENGNYSENAAYQLMNNEPDIYRNVILEFPQQDVFYNGVKINVFYDALSEGITLDREYNRGEYIFDVQLDKKYRARNWLEYSGVTVTNSDLMWQDCLFTWEDALQAWLGVAGNTDGAVFRQEIATKQPLGLHDILNIDLNNDLLSEQDTSPLESAHSADFRLGRWANGLYVNDLTKLSYNVPMLSGTFSLVCTLKAQEQLNDCILLVLSSAKHSMTLGYHAGLKQFYLTASDGNTLAVSYAPLTNNVDYFTFGISQSTSKRELFVHTYNNNSVASDSSDAGLLGAFNTIYCYPQIVPDIPDTPDEPEVDSSYSPKLGTGKLDYLVLA